MNEVDADATFPKKESASPIQVGVKLLVFNKDRILVMKRSGLTHANVAENWDIPGGRLKGNGEKVYSKSKGYEALSRELLEEVGLKLPEDQKPVFLARQRIDIKNKPSVMRLTYKINLDGDLKPALSPEHTEFKWVSIDELKKLDGLDPILKELLQGDKV